MLKINTVTIEGPDLSGKSTLYEALHEVTNFRWNIQDRSEFSMLCYAILYGRSDQSDGEYVLYWMAFNRRTENNFSLQFAVDKAIALNKPLLILETLWLDYPNASARFHKFVLDGMKDNERAFRKSPVTYIGYVERDVALRERLLQKLEDILGKYGSKHSPISDHKKLATRQP